MARLDRKGGVASRSAANGGGSHLKMALLGLVVSLPLPQQCSAVQAQVANHVGAWWAQAGTAFSKPNRLGPPSFGSASASPARDASQVLAAVLGMVNMAPASLHAELHVNTVKQELREQTGAPP